MRCSAYEGLSRVVELAPAFRGIARRVWEFENAFDVIRFPAFQQLVLKPGRSIGEIRPFLNLLLLITGILFVVFTLITVFQ